MDNNMVKYLLLKYSQKVKQLIVSDIFDYYLNNGP